MSRTRALSASALFGRARDQQTNHVIFINSIKKVKKNQSRQGCCQRPANETKTKIKFSNSHKNRMRVLKGVGLNWIQGREGIEIQGNIFSATNNF